MFNYKLYFKYILLNLPVRFVKNLEKENTKFNIFIYENFSYYTIFHLKLSSLYYSTQLLDMLTYDLPNNNKSQFQKTNTSRAVQNTPNVVIYNFNSILNQYRFFLFLIKVKSFSLTKQPINYLNLNSITELFLNANWLEREIAELHGIFFEGKKDLRNLMLQYGDTSTPMVKSFPSVGTRDIFYDVILDFLIQTPVTIQY